MPFGPTDNNSNRESEMVSFHIRSLYFLRNIRCHSSLPDGAVAEFQSDGCDLIKEIAPMGYGPIILCGETEVVRSKSDLLTVFFFFSETF